MYHLGLAYRCPYVDCKIGYHVYSSNIAELGKNPLESRKLTLMSTCLPNENLYSVSLTSASTFSAAAYCFGKLLQVNKTVHVPKITCLLPAIGAACNFPQAVAMIVPHWEKEPKEEADKVVEYLHLVFTLSKWDKRQNYLVIAG